MNAATAIARFNMRDGDAIIDTAARTWTVDHGWLVSGDDAAHPTRVEVMTDCGGFLGIWLYGRGDDDAAADRALADWEAAYERFLDNVA